MFQGLTKKILKSHSGYEERYLRYVPDARMVEQLRTLSTPTDLILFMGGWCPDCRIQVPRLLKILVEVRDIPLTIRIVEVDREKRDDAGIAEAHSVMKAPTFLFLRDGNELGRIVEAPLESMDVDMVRILTES